MNKTTYSNATIQTERMQRSPLNLTVFHYAAIFILCSLIGLLGETVVSFVMDGRLESRAGYVIGPLSPIYGLGAVCITAAVNPFRSKPVVLQFISAAFIGAAIEYFAGWALETQGGIVAWSYFDHPLNLHGHTSIIMAAVWGAVGIGWSLWGLPKIVSLVERVPMQMRRPLTIVMLVFIVVDSTLTIAALDSWFWRAAGYPPAGPVQEFCAQFFGDEFMRTRFETMGMWTELSSR